MRWKRKTHSVWTAPKTGSHLMISAVCGVLSGLCRSYWLKLATLTENQWLLHSLPLQITAIGGSLQAASHHERQFYINTVHLGHYGSLTLPHKQRTHLHGTSWWSILILWIIFDDLQKSFKRDSFLKSAFRLYMANIDCPQKKSKLWPTAVIIRALFAPVFNLFAGFNKSLRGFSMYIAFLSIVLFLTL